MLRKYVTSLYALGGSKQTCEVVCGSEGYYQNSKIDIYSSIISAESIFN